MKRTLCGSLMKKCSRWPLQKIRKYRSQHSCNVKEEEHCSGSVIAHSDNFHEVRHGICQCVEAGPNPPHIRGT